MSTKTTRREFLKQAAGAAAAVATAVVPVSGPGWTCPYCGTVNPAGVNRCGEGTIYGCGAPRPTGDAEGVSSVKASVSRRVCKICGRSKDEDPLLDLVALINPFLPSAAEKAELVWVCRHGHFDCTVIDAFTGMPVQMTGPDKRPPTLVVFNEDWRRKNRIT
jgi:hypothetical protein